MLLRPWLRVGGTGVFLLGGAAWILQAVEEPEAHGLGFAAKEVYGSARFEPLAPPPTPAEMPGGVVGGGVGGVVGGVVDSAPSPRVLSSATSESGPKVIRTADLILEVQDPLEARKEILTRLSVAKGWVAEQSEERDGDGHVTVRLRLRIPAEGFDATQQGLRGLGKVLEARTQAEDVSRQWVDREARLAVKRAAVVRLKQLLAQRTASLKDLLEAEKALVRETEEIESLEAVHRLQARQVSFATLELTLQGPRPQVGRVAYSPLERFGERSVARFGASLALLGLCLTTLLPWALMAGLGFLVYRRLRRPAALQETP